MKKINFSRGAKLVAIFIAMVLPFILITAFPDMNLFWKVVVSVNLGLDVLQIGWFYNDVAKSHIGANDATSEFFIKAFLMFFTSCVMGAAVWFFIEAFIAVWFLPISQLGALGITAIILLIAGLFPEVKKNEDGSEKKGKKLHFPKIRLPKLP